MIVSLSKTQGFSLKSQLQRTSYYIDIIVTTFIYVIHSKVIEQKLITPGTVSLCVPVHTAPVYDVPVKMSDVSEYSDRFHEYRVPVLLRNVFCVHKMSNNIQQRSRNFTQVVHMFNRLYFYRSHSILLKSSGPRRLTDFMEEKQIGFVMKSYDRILNFLTLEVICFCLLTYCF